MYATQEVIMTCYNNEYQNLLEALDIYEEKFEIAFLEMQYEIFGNEMIDAFFSIPCVKSDWKVEVRKSFLKMGLQWAYVDLVIEAKNYRDWIEQEIEQYNRCACHGRGCRSCL